MNIILWDYESVWPDMWPQNKCRSLWPIFHGPVILPYILKTVWCMKIIPQDYESVWPNISPQSKCRSLWPIWHGLVILPYILKTIWCMNIILCDYESVWHIDLKRNVGHCDIFYGPVILPCILKTVWYMNTSLQDYGSVWPDVWPQNICRPQWPVFQRPVIFPYILSWKLLSRWTSLSQYDPTSDLKIFVGHCDLYFMVHWICLISGKLFDVWTSYFRIMSQYDTTFDLEINVGHCVLYFMV